MRRHDGPRPEHNEKPNKDDNESCRSAVRRRKGKGLRPALRAPLPRRPGRGARGVFKEEEHHDGEHQHDPAA